MSYLSNTNLNQALWRKLSRILPRCSVLLLFIRCLRSVMAGILCRCCFAARRDLGFYRRWTVVTIVRLKTWRWFYFRACLRISHDTSEYEYVWESQHNALWDTRWHALFVWEMYLWYTGTLVHNVECRVWMWMREGSSRWKYKRIKLIRIMIIPMIVW